MCSASEHHSHEKRVLTCIHMGGQWGTASHALHVWGGGGVSTRLPLWCSCVFDMKASLSPFVSVWKCIWFHHNLSPFTRVHPNTGRESHTCKQKHTEGFPWITTVLFPGFFSEIIEHIHYLRRFMASSSISLFFVFFISRGRFALVWEVQLLKSEKVPPRGWNHSSFTTHHRKEQQTRASKQEPASGFPVRQPGAKSCQISSVNSLFLHFVLVWGPELSCPHLLPHSDAPHSHVSIRRVRALRM